MLQKVDYDTLLVEYTEGSSAHKVNRWCCVSSLARKPLIEHGWPEHTEES